MRVGSHFKLMSSSCTYLAGWQWRVLPLWCVRRAALGVISGLLWFQQDCLTAFFPFATACVAFGSHMAFTLTTRQFGVTHSVIICKRLSDWEEPNKMQNSYTERCCYRPI